MSERIMIKRLNRYLSTFDEKEREMPTAAGLANYLEITKEELFALAKSENEELRRAYVRAMNEMEHQLLSGAAFKRFNPTVVNICLQNVFGYGKDEQDEDIDLTLTVTGDMK